MKWLWWTKNGDCNLDIVHGLPLMPVNLRWSQQDLRNNKQSCYSVQHQNACRICQTFRLISMWRIIYKLHFRRPIWLQLRIARRPVIESLIRKWCYSWRADDGRDARQSTRTDWLLFADVTGQRPGWSLEALSHGHVNISEELDEPIRTRELHEVTCRRLRVVELKRKQ